MIFRLYIGFLLALVLGLLAQTNAEVTTEVIVVSIVNNVTVTQTQQVTTTQTVQQTGSITSTSRIGNLTTTMAGTGTGAMRPNATGTLMPVQGHATSVFNHYEWHMLLPLLAATFAVWLV